MMNWKDRLYLYSWVISFMLLFKMVLETYDLKWVVLMAVLSISMLLVVIYNDLTSYLLESENKKL